MRADLAELFLGLGRELSTRRSVEDVQRIVTERAYEPVPAAEQFPRHRRGNRASSGGRRTGGYPT